MQKPPKLPFFSRGPKNLVNTPMCKICMSPPPWAQYTQWIETDPYHMDCDGSLPVTSSIGPKQVRITTLLSWPMFCELQGIWNRILTMPQEKEDVGDNCHAANLVAWGVVYGSMLRRGM